jgi:virulence factor Mce-like protein
MNPQARLGAFVLIALLLLFFATGKISQGSWFKQDSHVVETEFDDLMGLDVESPVRMAGVKVGTVQEILLRDNRAVVRIALKPDVRLPASTRATIVSRGLVGEKNLALTAQPGDRELLPEGTIIPSDPSGDINTFIGKASGITEDLQKLTHALASSMKDEKSGSSLGELIANSNKAVEELSALIRENREDIHASSASMRKTMQTLETELPLVMRDLRQSARVINKLSEEIPGMLNSSKTFFDQGNILARNMNDTFVDNRENLYRILFELRLASENLEAFSGDVRRNPWKVLSERPEVKASPEIERRKMEEMLLTTGHMGEVPANE